jgi:hypothetical protein
MELSAIHLAKWNGDRSQWSVEYDHQGVVQNLEWYIGEQ